MSDARQQAPAAARNRAAILAVLRPHLRPGMTVLEIASGSGEHAVHFAAALPEVTFQPSDPMPAARASIDAWAAAAACGNLRPALSLDATAAWPTGPVDAVLCINMIHISPWEATLGLMRNAATVLRPGGLLALYGPYRRDGAPTAASNAAFDADLRRRDPAWGVRDIEAVRDAATAAGLAIESVTPMPANNLTVIFRQPPRQATAPADGPHPQAPRAIAD